MEAVQPEVAVADNMEANVVEAIDTNETSATTTAIVKEVATNATTTPEKLEPDPASLVDKNIQLSNSKTVDENVTVTMQTDAHKENPTEVPTSSYLLVTAVDPIAIEKTESVSAVSASSTVSAVQLAVDATEPAEAAPSRTAMDVNPVENVVTSATAMECEVETTLSEASSSNAPAASTNGLSLLAAYGSDIDSDNEEVTHIEDSDNEDVVEVPSVSSSLARRPVVAISSSSDSSSDSDSNSEAEYLTVLRKKIEKRINTENCDDDDDEDEEGDDARPRHRQPPKVRGEMLLDELPPIHQLEITVPEDECVELGKVQSIVDQLVLVSVLPNSMLFDLDTVLFLDKGRKVLGQVFDVLGQVADPLYCVRFNTNQQIKDRDINIGDIVYCAPKTEHTQFVILSKLMQVRGSDASWEHDVEPPARFIDYSDDEAERDARSEQRKRRQRERVNSTDSVETVATTTTEASEAPSAPPRQRGRRAQRDNRQSHNYHNGNQHPHAQSHSQSRDSEYNYHPSFNPGSWHSNYYHNYHPPAANFNMMPGMAFPMPAQGYGYMAPPHPYGMPPPMPMGMPPHMYPPPPSPYGHPQQPPN